MTNRFFKFIKNIGRGMGVKKSIYLIADLHLDHANIIRFCRRPFSTVQEMNGVLIRNWNNVVRPDDIVYCLGDVSFGRGSRPLNYWITKLNGHIIFIAGSHDKKNRGIRLHNRKILHYGRYRFLLLHDPDRKPKTWNSWVIHGHKHNKNIRKYPFINGARKTINVSVELINYRPLSIDKLLSLNIYSIKRLNILGIESARW
jgi:calcineurin-like phosphoesterase family protein